LELTEDARQFRCTGCGNCCRSLCVAVTAFDVARLVAATGRAAHELVAWAAPDEVDMVGEPQSFVELREGRRLMVLARENGACRLLGADSRCSAYAARPQDCRLFPFDVQPPLSGQSVRRLALLPLEGCDFARDGHPDPGQLATEDTVRWQELTEYQALVARWNRAAWHRRRLRKPLGSVSDFLRYALPAA
jgi:Fe-S-cluster containining protein